MTMQKIGQERIAPVRSCLRSLFESFFTAILIVSCIALLTTPPLYSMNEAHAVQIDANDSVSSPEPSFAQRFIDPMAKRVLPANMSLQYRYHTERQNQKPFKPQYTIAQDNKKNPLPALLPQNHNYPNENLVENLTVTSRDDRQVYCTQGGMTKQLRGKSPHKFTKDVALKPGQVFFHNGVLIEKVEGPVVGDYYFFEYHTRRRLFLQETPRRMPAPDGSCFGGEKLTGTPEAEGRPVVDENGELLYITKIVKQVLTLGETYYLVRIGNTDRTYISRGSGPVVYRPDKQDQLFTYLEDCVDIVKLHPNRARILFMSAVSACLGIPLYGVLRLYKKLTAHKKTHKKSANKQKPKSSDNKSDKSNTNQTDIQKATAQEASSEKENIITAQKTPSLPQAIPVNNNASAGSNPSIITSKIAPAMQKNKAYRHANSPAKP